MNTFKRIHFTIAAAIMGCVLAGSAVAMPADYLSAPAASTESMPPGSPGHTGARWRPGPPWWVPGPPPWAWRHHW